MPLARRWAERWPELLASGSQAARTWKAQARRALPEQADFLVLVDLTESMKREVSLTAAALRMLVPLAADEARGRRWGRFETKVKPKTVHRRHFSFGGGDTLLV